MKFVQLLSLNPNTAMVVLLLGLWFLLGCDKNESANLMRNLSSELKPSKPKLTSVFSYKWHVEKENWRCYLFLPLRQNEKRNQPKSNFIGSENGTK